MSGEDRDSYYGLISRESEKGNYQFIITSDILSDVILKYVINNKYDLVSVETDNPGVNVNLVDYCSKMVEERGYLALVMLQLSKEEVMTYNITLQKFDEIITIKSKGIVSTNTIVDQDLLNTMINSYLGVKDVR